jgi:hypothetical protein
MKTIIWKTPNKMEIHTGNKTFDKKCLTLSEGNVCSPTQTSRYIRPKTETQCNFRNFPEGVLRDADLEIFTKAQPYIPRHVLDRVLKETETKPICLYRIFHCVGEKRITHGWILTQSHEKDHELIAVFLSDSQRKTFAIMDEVVQYVSNPPKETQKTA